MIFGRRQIIGPSYKELRAQSRFIARESGCNNYRAVVITYPDDRNTLYYTAFMALAVNPSQPRRYGVITSHAMYLDVKSR